VHDKRRPISYTETACLHENGHLIAVAMKCSDDASSSREWISGAMESTASLQLLSTRLLHVDKNENRIRLLRASASLRLCVKSSDFELIAK